MSRQHRVSPGQGRAVSATGESRSSFPFFKPPTPQHPTRPAIPGETRVPYEVREEYEAKMLYVQFVQDKYYSQFSSFSPCRYSVWLKDGVVELRVDLLTLFQALQLLLGGAGRGPSIMEMHRVRGLTRPGVVVQKQSPPSLHDTVWGEVNEAPLQPALQLGLALHCSLADKINIACENHGVHLKHTPFIAMTYR